MTMSEINNKALRQLAKFYGIQLSYVNDFGKRKQAEREIIFSLLQSMNCAIDSPQTAMESLEHDQYAYYSRIMEPVNVAWQGQNNYLPLYFDTRLKDRTCLITCRLEDGSTREWPVHPGDLLTRETLTIKHTTFEHKQLPLDHELPQGYHELTIQYGSQHTTSLLICAPKHVRAINPDQKLWGAFIPLYAFKSDRNWGVGDTGDLKNFVNWQSRIGGQIVGTLPLYANYMENYFDPSPYSPISRLMLNEIYLDIEALPELDQCPQAYAEYQRLCEQGELEALRQSSQVQYRAVYKTKKSVLMKLAHYFFEHHSPERWDAFQRFLKRWPIVNDYARFRAYQARHNYSGFPKHITELAEEELDQSTLRYHLYCQWQLFEQLHSVQEICRQHDTHLYLDLPVGSHPMGFDSHYFFDTFARGAAIGAPPDRVFVRGQNWGVAPFQPNAIRNQRYHYFILCLRAIMPFISMLRLDHIMQFHRLFWIPDGASAQQGTFVRYRMNEFYAILCLEARRHNVDLIGENLGTVPTEVNRKMAEHHLKKMFVVQYEIDSQDQITHYKVPRHSIASLNTHDMPTFFGYCLGNDLKRRIRHGLLTRREALEVYHGRKKTLQSLADFLYSDGYMEEQPLRVYILLKACLTFLARSRCRYLLVNFEDLWGETQQQNVPGTWDEHPNWRNKLRYSLEELDELANFKYILSLINNNRHKRNSNHDAAAEGSRQTTRAS